MIGWIVNLFTGGVLKRVFATIDQAGLNDVEREKARLAALQSFVQSQQETWRGPGFWLAIMFVAPLAFWFCSVCIYCVFWCAKCAYPQPWSIAALPPPLDQWAGGIISSLFIGGGLAVGMVGAARIFRRG
jgi:hypothetical protein